jgi:hypothetical protein
MEMNQKRCGEKALRTSLPVYDYKVNPHLGAVLVGL